jgi:uncharacterized protein YyaL (SSP411 family)
VDREERPDIDALYMTACQLVTGSGGWPLTIIMTPEKKPFFAGTYIPRQTRPGHLGVVDLCQRIRTIYRDQHDEVLQSADAITGHLSQAFTYASEERDRPDAALLNQATREIARHYDPEHGGFDGAPKFPTPHRLLYLLNRGKQNNEQNARGMAVKTLTAMRLGGIWDHVGFGFHRYATDKRWLLPHFEKMLYDQAWLAMAYLRGFEISGDPLFRQTVHEILTYVLRDMTSPEGGFYTAEDADSEGEEGKFYLWSKREFGLLASVASNGFPWTEIFNLESEGNFFEEASRRKTGTNILHLTEALPHWADRLGVAGDRLADEWTTLRQALLARRDERVRPLRDDKILTDWNGMMIAALARAGSTFNMPAYMAAADQAADFLLERMRHPQGRLLHRYREGQAAIDPTANDYAALVMGLIELYKATRRPDRLEQAAALQEVMDADFWDGTDGGYFLSRVMPDDDPLRLPVRPKELYDGAMPSANSIALNNLVQLGALMGEADLKARAVEQLQAFAGSVRRQPTAFTHTLNGWQLALAG